jgi:5-methylthioadenosine/S-adenosylhomocysteine deaminase
VTDRILIRNGIVLTQDDALGEMAGADVLVEGNQIVDVGRGLSADGARVIDADGDIVIPGFIDTHRHTWETCLRTCAPDFPLITYFSAILDKFAPHYRPDDVYSSTLWGSLECLNAGITTLVDWAHIMNTPDHADASVRALQESRIRSVFAYGFPNTSLVDWWFGPDYTGSVLTSDGDEARRLRSQYFSAADGLDGRITMALATRGPGFCKPDVVRHDWELAKELGINVTVHVAMDRFGYTKGQIAALRDMDLLYPGTTYIHASHFTDEEWKLVADSGGNVSFAPQIEVQMGHGWAPAVTAVEHSIPIGLSSDVATTASADQFTQMHAIFGTERGRKHQAAWDASLDGLEASPGLITSRQVLRWATLGGAEVAGIADRTGSITPGKRADLVIIDTKAVNVAPVIDPVGAVVCAADISNVRTVLVDGEVVKDEFRLTASLDDARRSVEASRDYLLEAFGDPEPGWLVGAGSGRSVESSAAN